MSTQPRNPRHFPRMKVRGYRRRGMAWSQRALRGFDHLAASAKLSGLQMKLLAEAMRYEEGNP